MEQQLDLLSQPRMPNRGTDCYELLCALRNGERLTEYLATVRYHITAASQRFGDLRRRFGWPIRSQFIETEGGARVKEYWIER